MDGLKLANRQTIQANLDDKNYMLFTDEFVIDLSKDFEGLYNLPEFSLNNFATVQKLEKFYEVLWKHKPEFFSPIPLPRTYESEPGLGSALEF